MAPVALKYVVSFSSQDDHNKVQNLIAADGFKKWLSHPKDKSGQIDAIFQLEEPSQLAYIDIGSQWCASIELKVGRSDWPQDELYRSLVPNSTLMTLAESKLSKGIVKTRMFTSEDFPRDVRAEKWDRLRVICRQPHRKDVQFGLSFIKIRSAATKPDKSADSDTDSLLRSPTSGASVTSIQNHFFGKVNNTNIDSPDDTKTRLMKIAMTSENGCEQGGVLSRTAKLVLAAADTAGKYSPLARAQSSSSSRVTLFSEHLAQKYGPRFEEELNEFLASLQIEAIDLDTVTIADLRHKFERKKKRKLTSDEKKTFMGQCESYICGLFDSVDSSSQRLSPLNTTSANTESSLPLPNEIIVNRRRETLTDSVATPTRCKRKLDTEGLPTISPKTPRTQLASSVASMKIHTPSPSAGVSMTTPTSSGSATAKALLQNLRKDKENSRKSNKKINFNTDSINSVAKNSTPQPRRTKKCVGGSQDDRVESCGEWLSKDQGQGGSSESDHGHVAPRGRGGRRQRGSSTTATTPKQTTPRRGRGSNNATSQSRVNPVDTTVSTSGNYVYCSSCKGNVPEQVFPDHYIRCKKDQGFNNTGPVSSRMPRGRGSRRGHGSVSTFRADRISTFSQPPVGMTNKLYSCPSPSSDSDSDSDVINISGDDAQLVECPLCGDFYPADVIAVHADVCASNMEVL